MEIIMNGNYIAYNSFVLHAFSQLQPILFMLICAPIRNFFLKAVRFFCAATFRPLLLSKKLVLAGTTNGIRNNADDISTAKSQETKPRIRICVLGFFFLTCLLVVLSLAASAFLLVQNAQLKTFSSGMKTGEASLRPAKFINLQSYDELLMIPDFREDCLVSGGYPILHDGRCCSVFPPAFLTLTILKSFCSSRAMSLYYPRTLREAAAVNEMLKHWSGETDAPKIVVGYTRSSFQTTARYRSWDGKLTIGYTSDLWGQKIKSRSHLTVCQKQAKLSECLTDSLYARKKANFICC